MKLRFAFFTLLTGALSLAPQLAAAQSGAKDLFQEGLNTAAQTSGLRDSNAPTASLQSQVGLAINGLLAAVGMIFLVVILIGGYQWMTAGGSEEKVSKAKGMIINGVNGMLVIFLAFALVQAILSALGSATAMNG